MLLGGFFSRLASGEQGSLKARPRRSRSCFADQRVSASTHQSLTCLSDLLRDADPAALLPASVIDQVLGPTCPCLVEKHLVGNYFPDKRHALLARVTSRL